MSFLEQEGFLAEGTSGAYDVKMEMLNDKDFKYRLNRLYLGRRNGRNVFGGLSRMVSLLGELDVNMEGYLERARNSKRFLVGLIEKESREKECLICLKKKEL